MRCFDEWSRDEAWRIKWQASPTLTGNGEAVRANEFNYSKVQWLGIVVIPNRC